MANVKWSDHAMIRMREQTRYIAEQSGSTEIAWKWASDVFNIDESTLAEFDSVS